MDAQEQVRMDWVEHASDPRRMYLDLLRGVLSRSILPETWREVDPARGSLRGRLFAPVRMFLHRRGLRLVRRAQFVPAERATGLDWPPEAETMIGLERLRNVQECVADVLERGVPGDLIETGVWRGGTVIFMRAILRVYGDETRSVWAADSFRGLPKADPRLRPEDAVDNLWRWKRLAVSLEEVRANFKRYGLLDDRVRFLEGWFEDTLPTAPIERLSVLRLDGDMYDSTKVALESLYPKVSPGGFVIVDDYGAVRGCRKAVDEFRLRQGIADEINWVDWTGVFWRKSG